MRCQDRKNHWANGNLLVCVFYMSTLDLYHRTYDIYVKALDTMNYGVEEGKDGGSVRELAGEAWYIPSWYT